MVRVWNICILVAGLAALPSVLIADVNLPVIEGIHVSPMRPPWSQFVSIGFAACWTILSPAYMYSWAGGQDLSVSMASLFELFSLELRQPTSNATI